MDIRSLTQEHQANKRALEPKVLWDMALVGWDSSLDNNDGDIRPAILARTLLPFPPLFLLSTLTSPTHFSTLLYPWFLLPFISLFPQERSLTSQEGDIQSMQSALAALQAELGTELLSQLDSSDQREVRALQQTSIIDMNNLLLEP